MHKAYPKDQFLSLLTTKSVCNMYCESRANNVSTISSCWYLSHQHVVAEVIPTRRTRIVIAVMLLSRSTATIIDQSPRGDNRLWVGHTSSNPFQQIQDFDRFRTFTFQHFVAKTKLRRTQNSDPQHHRLACTFNGR
jgi:hypothetical protein